MMKLRKVLAWLILSIILMPVLSYSKPHYSMLTGNKCINCHFNPNGGGQRNSLGWYSRKDNGLIKLQDFFAEELYNMSIPKNEEEDILINSGFDYRFQTARLGRPDSSHRDYFSMQLSPYISVEPFQWLKLSGHYNFVEALYPGQESWSAQVIIQPSYDLPLLRAGYISPSIGTKYDDHTMLIRQSPGAGKTYPMIPPDYAEWGAELRYESIKWLSLTAGAYSAENMSEITIPGPSGLRIPQANSDMMSYLFRFELWPRMFEDELNTNIGASFFINDDFRLVSLYLNLGLTDRMGLLTEYVIGNKEKIRETNNYFAELYYQLFDFLTIYTRYEKANTKFVYDDNQPEYKTTQYVFGGNFYPFGFMEIRPEYRIYDRELFESYQSQWAVQVHLYY
jgi:hypothetical protein